MEDWQKSAILRNIDKLIELTVCNISLLAKLQANGMLSKNDADKLSVLGSSQSSHSQSYELYNIISTRKDGYQKLIACLRETLQTGAVEILTTEETKWKTTGLDDILSITYDEKIQLGTGSNGTVVYKGKLGNRDVAVKRVNSDVTKATMIIREVENLKICDIHTNIVRYFGSKQTHNSLLIVLELCDMTLKDWVFNNKSIDMLPFEILRQITSGLDWLHKRRIVHRDLKPENILLLAQVKQVKISDFGLSRTISEERSCVSSAGFGTQGWVAPEVLAQIDSEDGKNCQFTFASDVFSLGCVFYYVITDGKHPFGSLVMRNANILKGNHTMDPNEVLHACVLDVMFITLMISQNPKSRPQCSNLFSCPILWSLDTRSRFIENLSSFDSLKPFLQPTQKGVCKFDHTAEIEFLKAKDCKNADNFGCSVLLAYVQSQKHNELITTPDIWLNTNEIGETLEKSFENPSREIKRFEQGGDRPDMPAMKLSELENVSGVLKTLPTAKSSTSKGFKGLLKRVVREKPKGIHMGSSSSTSTSSKKRNSVGNEPIVQTKVHQMLSALKELSLEDRTTRIFEIVKTEDLNTMKDILEKLGKLNNISKIWDDEQKSLLHAAVGLRDLSIVEYLVNNHGFRSKLSKDRFKNDLVYYCMWNIHEIDADEFEEKCKILQFLFATKPDLVDSRNDHQCTPLHIVTLRKFDNGKQLELMRLLIENKADLNAKAEGGETPLITAVTKSDSALVDKIKLLITHHADPNIASVNGNTFLHLAARIASPATFHNLILYLVSIEKTNLINRANSDGLTVLQAAVHSCEMLPETLEIFKNHGTDFNIHNNDGETALYCAIIGGKSEQFLKLLLQYGADWKALTNKQHNVLHYAADYGNEPALKLFLSLGCDVNAKNVFGNTPLHDAFLGERHTSHEIVAELLKSNANVHLKNKFGKSPADLAHARIQAGKIEERTVELLQNAISLS